MHRTAKRAVALAATLACLAFPGTATAFGPERAHPVEASSRATASAPAPEPPPVAQSQPVSMSPAQPEIDETVVAEQYQAAIAAADTPVEPATPTSLNPAEDPPDPASEPPETSPQSGQPRESVSPAAATDRELEDPGPSAVKLLRRVHQVALKLENSDEAARTWYRDSNLHYQAAIKPANYSNLSLTISSALSPSSSRPSRRTVHPISAQIRGSVRGFGAHDRLERTARTRDGPGHCEDLDFQLPHGASGVAAAWKARTLTDSHRAHLIETVLKVRDAETIEAVGKRFRGQNATLLDCPADHILPSSFGQSSIRPDPLRRMLRAEREATPSTPATSAGRRGAVPSSGSEIGVEGTARSAADKVARRPGSFDTAIVGPLRRILPTQRVRPSPEAAERLTDTRRLVQIGIVLAMAYVAFLTLWFWGTRARRRIGGGREL